MKKGFILLLIIIAFLTHCTNKTAPGREPNYMRMADSEMRRNPESWMIDFQDKIKWNYTHGLEMQAFIQVSEKTGDEQYFTYAENYADTMINDDGAIQTYRLERYNIDHINPGKMLFPIYEKTANPKYLKALQLLRSQMETHPRISNGGFWHKQIYPHQVWLDGLYMACPFLAEYGKTFNEPALFDEVALQLTTAYQDLIDEETGLLYHGWDESREQRWADPVTGRSPHFWSRSIGWYMMALVDVLDFIPESHPGRADLVGMIQGLADALPRYQHETGLWYQVMDKGDKEGNYLEASVSSMFMYSFAKAVNKGYIDEKYRKVAERAYNGLMNVLMVENEDGTLTLTQCNAVSGLGGNPYRDGSFEYYVNERIRENDAKATGPFIMGCLELNK